MDATGRARAARRVGAAAAAALFAVLLLGTPARAAEVSGCQGTAQSFDAKGAPLDQVNGPGTGGTKADPFTIDPNGRVTYSGSSDAVLQNGRWSVDVGLPVDISGKVTNASGQTQWSGDEKVADRAPFDAPGLYRVSFRVTGSNGATPCTGSVWVEVGGSPVGTPLWIGGVAVLLLGAADVAWAVVAALKGVGV